MAEAPLTLDLIKEASSFLEGKIRRTPIEYSTPLSELLGVPTWLKMESLQMTGSFKIRGAWFRLSRLNEAQRKRGIATCSAGNHGKAIAYAADKLKIDARIYLPRTVDSAKHKAIVALGAKAILSDFDGYDDTEVWAMEEAQKLGLPFISAFEDSAIMAGNGGSLAMEVEKQLPEAMSFVLPVGGGGLSAGFAMWMKDSGKPVHIVGAQLEASPALARSMETGKAVTRMPVIETVAGALEGGIGSENFEVLRSRVDHVALVTEEEIRAAFIWMIDNHQYLIEPSSAVVIAACLAGKVGKLEGPTVLVVSGRNVALSTVSKLLGN